MSGIEFTDEIANRLESVYLTSDVIAQREATLKHVIYPTETRFSI
jgi:hypothetical protein